MCHCSQQETFPQHPASLQFFQNIAIRYYNINTLSLIIKYFLEEKFVTGNAQYPVKLRKKCYRGATRTKACLPACRICGARELFRPEEKRLA
ncbi:MAG: hypothetical protein C4570_02200 [Ammonifex sp.]|nr:MAG: hypothetical protein C4570_02200 [Ammonifex sp.]